MVTDIDVKLPRMLTAGSAHLNSVSVQLQKLVTNTVIKAHPLVLADTYAMTN